MKKLFFGLLAISFLANFGAKAQEEIFLHQIQRDLDKNAYANKTNLHDKLFDNSYIAIDLHLPILPSDLSAAVGYEIAGGKAEVELYVSARLSRYLSSEHDLHLPVGARVRIALNDSQTVYLEYQREFTVVNNNDYGLYETPNMVSVMYRFDQSQIHVGCGVGQKTHHAWRDEDHAPENGVYFECKFGKKF